MKKLLGSLSSIVATTPVTTPPPPVTIVIHPRCNNSASITVIVGPASNGDQHTLYNGDCESALIHALREARNKFPDAVVVWEGWEGWSERAFRNHPAHNLCLRVDAEYVDVYGSTLPQRRLIIC